ncbi:hypothetical protein [Anaeromyxobacter sp. Fw109-5]|uniref:hypothetical protein n=1 Tax=Anaeromyxobacter sp. (strain Fw109-5) TaxID=404589 RepID=UPI000158A4E0|nr:hypothetical protein [Anaeromyxobacter sp. Fw109-5]ABS25300.1 hypothetical protein Anae109_1092 [Anaeromyxobacter sp. Fw109-5]
MSRTKTAVLCAVALAGLAVSVRSTLRVRVLDQQVKAALRTGQAEGASFVETLRGEHAERQRLALDRRREVALALARARRDRLLGALAIAGVALVYAAGRVLSRLAQEVESDHLHVGPGAERGPDRS